MQPKQDHKYYRDKWAKYVNKEFKSLAEYARQRDLSKGHISRLTKMDTALPEWCLNEIGFTLVTYFKNINTDRLHKVTPNMEEKIRKWVREYIATSGMKDKDYAALKGITPTQMSNIKSNKKSVKINNDILSDIGFERVKLYRRIGK